MTIQLMQPSISQAEIDVATATLQSLWIGKGKQVDAFETAWAEHVGVPRENIVSTNSCTSALFEAVRLAGIGLGDEVIIPTVHFVGAAQAVIAAGGTPVFCDVDRWTLNATDETIDAVWTERTKAVLLNHYGGNMCQITRGYFPRGTVWIDDLACAPMVKISELERCEFAMWSMDSMKVLTCGDGGFLYCQDVELSQYARQDFCLGTNSESGVSNLTSTRWWAFGVERLAMGRHLMNDIAASIGLVQLSRLDKLVARREEVARKYREAFLDLSAVLDYKHGIYFSWIYVNERDELARYLRSKDIYVSFRYFPLHLAFWTSNHLPNAEWIVEHALNLPLHANLSDEDVQYIIDTVCAFYDNGYPQT